MLLNYFKIAVRNILRNRLHSFINIIGLSIGLACAVLLLLYILDELSYDRHFSKHDRVFVVLQLEKYGNEELLTDGSPFPFGPKLKDEYPFVEQYARTHHFPDKLFLIDRNGETILEQNIRFADPWIFDVLDHNFIYGSPEGALDSPGTIVINQTLARKYFGDENPVGKILKCHNGSGYTVKGVFKDLPQNTSLTYDGLITMHSLADVQGREKFREYKDRFNGSVCYTYILLKKSGDIKSITGDFERFRKKYMDFQFRYGYAGREISFISLTDYHLHYKLSPNLMFDNLGRLYILFSLVIFILVIACINYMNLATARSMGRAREVGVRKVLGADRVSLMRQFLMESMLITIVSMLIAIAFVELSLPTFNLLVSKELSLRYTGNGYLILSILAVTLGAGILSGSYPAIIMSSFPPEKVLRKNSGTGTGKGRLRKLLVVFQYSISIVMIICMMLSIKQMNYLDNMDRGFDGKDIFYISLIDDGHDRMGPILREDFNKYAGISAVSGSSVPMISFGMFAINHCKVEDENGNFVERQVDIQKVGKGYIDMMGMEIIDGRSFHEDMRDSAGGGVLINETFAGSMGWNDSPVGKPIHVIDKFYRGSYNVIGVFKDIHGRLYDGRKKPGILIQDDKYERFRGLCCITLKISPESQEETLQYIRKKLREIFPLDPPGIYSVEDDIEELYKTEKMLNRLLIFSSIFCTLIACLGFLGLSSFIAESKTKEIGIRKVNGASVQNIVLYLTNNFMKLVLISGVIACPAAYWIMDKWFERFSDRVGMGPGIFISGIIIAMIIAWLTVSFHSIKAAMTDPVKALRYE